MKRIILITVIICALLAVGIFVSWWLAFSIGLVILGTLGHVERIFKIKWSKKWTIFLLILFLLLSGAYITTSFTRSRHSEGQIVSLSKKESGLRKDLKQAENDLAVAKEHVASLIEKERELRQKLQEAEEVASITKEQIADLSEYGEVATYTFSGYQESGKFVSPTPVSNWAEGYLTVSNNNYLFKCSHDAIEYYKELINKYPKFPFPYLALSACLLNNRDPSWKQYAMKAQSILKKTTKVSLHCKAHDGWLEQVNKILDPNQLDTVFTKGKLHKSE
jgi:energy-coupling factor transporter transmembrane protein EcfT